MGERKKMSMLWEAGKHRLVQRAFILKAWSQARMPA